MGKMDHSPEFPTIRPLGLDGLLVSFAGELRDSANRAALAFGAAAEQARFPGVLEVSTSLVSAYFRFDPLTEEPGSLRSRIAALLESRDWTGEPLPSGRRLWRVPAAFGGSMGPRFAEAAESAGLTEAEAVEELANARLRVLALGFAPGQPYLGQLGERWNLPRRADLAARVPGGSLGLAIRQIVLFTGAATTGWHHVGQTRFRNLDLDKPEPDAIALRPGDEMAFEPCNGADLDDREIVREPLE